MSDLISRQAVLDELEKWDWQDLYLPIHFKQILDDVPSVENKGEPIESARTLKKHCINTKDCKECFMWDECKYELSAPCDWDLPDGEKGGE